MKFKSLLFSALAVALAAASCKKESVPSGDPYITVSPKEISFVEKGEPQTITVDSNREWKIEDSKPFWITVSPTSGSASSKVTVSVEENKGEERTGTIVFTTGSITAKLTVKQAGTPVTPGDGTKEHPYRASEAIAVAKTLDASAQVQAYVKGIISSIKSIDTGQFGNAEYCISNDGKTTEEFLIFRGYYLNGDKFTSENQIKVGDEVVIFGKIVNYNGEKPEMTSGSKIISLNGVEPEPPTPITGENLLDNPGFENWTDDTTPADWKQVSSNATIAKESAEKHSGSYSAKITGATDGNKRLMSKTYKLKAGKYQLSAYAKGEGQIRIGWAKVSEGGTVESGNDYFYLTDATVAGTEWTQYSGQFELTESTRVSIVLMNAKTGQGLPFFADDIELVTENGGKEEDIPSNITVDKAACNFTKDGGTETVALTSTVSWSAAGNPAWVTVSPASGSASASVQITAEANTGAARTATITFAGSTPTDKAVLTVKQAAGDTKPTTGDGTLDNPYTASDALSVASALEDGAKVNAYVKGIISSIKSIDTGQFGNAEYCISDDGSTTGEFLIYRGYYLNGDKFTSEDQIKVGDAVVVLGDLVNYKDKQGNFTPEMNSGSKIISLNGETPTPPTPPTPSGEYASTIEWTLGTYAYTEKATVNGEADVPVLKIGKSNNGGSATLKVKAGTSAISFYAVAWKAKSPKLIVNGTELSPVSQDGASSTAPYTLTVSDSDFYTVSLGSALAKDTDIEVTTDKERVIIFAVNPGEGGQGGGGGQGGTIDVSDFNSCDAYYWGTDNLWDFCLYAYDYDKQTASDNYLYLSVTPKFATKINGSYSVYCDNEYVLYSEDGKAKDYVTSGTVNVQLVEEETDEYWPIYSMAVDVTLKSGKSIKQTLEVELIALDGESEEPITLEDTLVKSNFHYYHNRLNKKSRSAHKTVKLVKTK